jgi:mannosyltransferase OCH1-like enzyme
MKKPYQILIFIIIITFLYFFIHFSAFEMPTSWRLITSKIGMCKGISSRYFEYFEDTIPKQVFLTWQTKNLPPKMAESVKKLKGENPEFEYYLYDDIDRRNFIVKNFETNVVTAYDALIPGAYQADLWRYCILYKLGGIYLDIKFYTVNGFKLLSLTDKEYFIRDIEPSGSGVINGLIVSKPGNQKLLNCINEIVNNVKNKYYGNSPLEPTGPLLLVKQFNENELNKFENIGISEDKCPTKTCINKDGIPIFAIYDGYLEEKNQFFSKNATKDYGALWVDKRVYK